MQQIKIKALDIFGKPISKIADKILLDIEYNKTITHTLSNPKEQSDGIYVFDNIPSNISPFANIFIRLASNTLVPNTSNRYYCQNPYFLPKTCTQINKFQAMLDNTKSTPYMFDMQIQTKANIGIIKAYKKDKDSKDFLPSGIDGLSNPYNEIYTIDIEQEIQLRAFVYEGQRTYTPQKEIKDTSKQTKQNHTLQRGNITKTIIANKHILDNIAEEDIKWAFKIVDNSYHGKNATTGRLKEGTNQSEPFPPLTNKLSTINLTDKNYKRLDSIPSNNDYVEIEGKYGTILELKLADLFDENLLNPNNKETLINKNIIFFAYDNNAGINTSNDIKRNAYRVYSDKGTSDSRIVTTDRVTAIELKIVKTRFRLEFDGNVLVFLENEREIIHKPARSGMPLNNLKADSKENMERKRFALPDINNQSFYYDLYLHKQDSTKPLEEGIYYLKVENVVGLLDYYILNKNNDDLGKYKIPLYDNENMTNTNTTGTSYSIHGGKELGDNKGIDLANNAKVFFEVLKQYVKNTKIAIPLNVKYQKRILITIERFKQTTESTKSRMNIFIDGKRVVSKDNITDKLQNSSLNQTNPYAYILERNGPDCIGGELKLRIPEGRYGVSWYDDNNAPNFQKNTLNLKNNFVHQDRHILIHDGFSPKMSDGCLLIKSKEAKDKDGNIVDNVLDEKAHKSIDFHSNVQKKLTKEILGKTTNNIKEFVEMYIEIKVRNSFEINTN